MVQVVWAEFWLQCYSYHGVLTPNIILDPTFRPQFGLEPQFVPGIDHTL